MIIYRRWHERRALFHGHVGNWDCDGWFLFGLLPLYIRKVELVR